eukprot:5585872-Pyramimonas_sp.AAC.2
MVPVKPCRTKSNSGAATVWRDPTTQPLGAQYRVESKCATAGVIGGATQKLNVQQPIGGL